MGRRHLGLGVIQNKLPWKGGSVWKPECTSGLAGKGAFGGHSWWAPGASALVSHGEVCMALSPRLLGAEWSSGKQLFSKCFRAFLEAG